mmetsp:Transcript_12319/g.29930  ORF Transcript_12319/g.29930 Transcript_12319/m.29930 type:complete len:110 (+) Transcript_12319:669-998(+)
MESVGAAKSQSNRSVANAAKAAAKVMDMPCPYRITSHCWHNDNKRLRRLLLRFVVVVGKEQQQHSHLQQQSWHRSWRNCGERGRLFLGLVDVALDVVRLVMDPKSLASE